MRKEYKNTHTNTHPITPTMYYVVVNMYGKPKHNRNNNNNKLMKYL